jgi:hypothetical protein
MVLNLKNLDDWGIGAASDYCKLYLPFNSNINDISGNGNTVTLGNSTYKKLKDGRSHLVCFNSTTTIGSTSAFNFSTNPFTIFMWMNTTSSAVNAFILSPPLASPLALELSPLSSNGKFGFYTATTGHLEISNTTLNTGVWKFVVITRSGTSLKCYINGVLDKDTSISGSLVIGETNSWTFATYTSYYGNGSYCNFGSFSGIALTAGQIKALYDATYIE